MSLIKISACKRMVITIIIALNVSFIALKKINS